MRRIVLCLLIMLIGVVGTSNAWGQKIKIKTGGTKEKKEDKKENKNDAMATGAFKVGDVAEGLETDGKWYKVDILKAEPGKYFIHWQGFKSQYDRWIEADKVRAVGSKSSASASTSGVTASSAASGNAGAQSKVYGTGVGGFKVGEYAEVLDRDGKWYEAEIQKVNDGQTREYFVKIEGYSGFWVKEANLRVKVAGASNEPEGFKVGDKIEAVDFGRWNKGTIQSIRKTNSGNLMFTVAFDNGGSKEFAQDKLRNIAVYNFSGLDFKTGQYVRVWYSGNDSLDGPIVDIKDGKFLINYGGYGATWFAFDDPKVRNDARSAAIASARAMQDRFFEDVNKYSDAIRIFGYLYNKKHDTRFVLYNQGLSSPRPSDVAPMLKQMDELDALIKSKYPNIQNTEQTWTSELSKNPGHWRVIAEERQELAQSVVADMLKDKLSEATRILGNFEYLKNHEIQGFEAGKGIGVFTDLQDILDNNGVEFMKKEEEKVAEAIKAAQAANLGQNEIAEFRAFLKKLSADVKSKFDASLLPSGFNPTAHDAAAEGTARTYIQKTYAGSTILKIGVIGGQVIEKNNLGIPLYRYKKVGVLFRDSKGRCRFVPAYYREDYAGGGAYGAPYIEHHFTYYQKCN